MIDINFCQTNNMHSFQLTTVLDNLAKVSDVDTFDFEKAFNTPPHVRLKGKLLSYGIVGAKLKWMNAFPVLRQQSVAVNKTGLMLCLMSNRAPFFVPYFSPCTFTTSLQTLSLK